MVYSCEEAKSYVKRGERENMLIYIVTYIIYMCGRKQAKSMAEKKRITAVVCFLLPLCSAKRPPETSLSMMAWAA